MSTNAQESTKQIYIRVSGRVQGVFFRVSAQRKGRELGLRGFVRNLENGGVEVVAQGPQKDVETLLTWCRQGPEHAQVRNLESRWQAVDESLPNDFEVRL